MKTNTVLFFFILFTLLVSSCRGDASPSKVSQTPPNAPDANVSIEEPTSQPAQEAAVPQAASASEVSTMAELAKILGNLSYSGLFPDQQITLTDGYAYYEEQGPGIPYVQMIDHSIATGDLNDDGAEDAVVMLVDYSTGSGDFVYLAALLNIWDNPTLVEALMVGDLSPVKSLLIHDSQVIVDLIAPGPGDPDCCPTWNVRKIFDLADGKLVELSSDALSKASLNDLSSTSWQLVDLNIDQESVLPETEIMLTIENDQISGSAGCNTYNGTVSGDESMPQVFTVGPISATRMQCTDAVSNQETTYLDRLAKIATWRYDFGNLALIYKHYDGDYGELLFVPHSPSSAK